MSDIAQLYKDAIKHLRVVRNIVRAHQRALNVVGLDLERMTSYERGRMTRSSTKLASIFAELVETHRQDKIVLLLDSYASNIANWQIFRKAGSPNWFLRSDVDDSFITDTDVELLINHIVGMIDSPLSEVPKRIMMLRLSI